MKLNVYVIDFLVFCLLGLVFYFFVELIDIVNFNLPRIGTFIIGFLIITGIGDFVRKQLFGEREKINKNLLYLTKSGFVLVVIMLTFLTK